jgi:hypothetical protein
VKTDVTTAHPEPLSFPAFPVRTRRWLYVAIQNAVGDRASPHNLCLPHKFFLQGISWLLLFDVVGRRQRSPHILLHSSRQKITNFCLTLDLYFILFPFPLN